jgi:hypothetical protein
MYSKCIVSPFMSTPIAIMASKGAVLEAEGEVLVEAAEVRSVIEVDESRSVAEAKSAPPVPDEEDWI